MSQSLESKIGRWIDLQASTLLPYEKEGSCWCCYLEATTGRDMGVQHLLNHLEDSSHNYWLMQSACWGEESRTRKLSRSGSFEEHVKGVRDGSAMWHKDDFKADMETYMEGRLADQPAES